MAQSDQQTTQAASAQPALASPIATASRIKSEDLFRQSRELEIDHQGRIYRLRLTQLNKMILTA